MTNTHDNLLNKTEGGRPPLHVLVVDDQPSMRWLLTRILRDAGFKVAVAETFSQAFELFARERPAMAIIDYRLPDGDGLTLFGRLRQLDPGCRAILMTSYGGNELREQAIHAGMAAYLDKPFSNEKLISLLHEVGDAAAKAVPSHDSKDLPREGDRPRDANLPSGAAGLGVRGGDSTAGGESLEVLSRSERLRALGELCAGVAHELGNELTMISSASEQLHRYLQTLEEGRRAPRKTRGRPRGEAIDQVGVKDGLALSDLILDEIRKMDGMLKGLRDQVLYRKVERHEGDVGKILRQLFVLLEPECRRRHTDLVLDLGERPAVGLWDRDGLRQIFVNLLINALEAVSEIPDATVTVRSRVDKAEGYVTVEVVNNGPSLPDPNLLFRPFVTSKPEGTGLGLYLSRRMAQSEGGTITARNLDGGGVSFAVRLPLGGGGGEASAAPARGTL